MTPYYGYGRGNKPYFYYQCTKRQHQGSCSMANVPAQPLEDVIARRLNQLSKEDRTIERLVKDERVARLTEPRLRHLVGLQPVEQLRRFRMSTDAFGLPRPVEHKKALQVKDLQGFLGP